MYYICLLSSDSFYVQLSQFIIFSLYSFVIFIITKNIKSIGKNEKDQIMNFFQSSNQAEIRREPQYLYDRIISKQEKGLQQLKAYLRVRIKNNQFQQIQKIINYFIFRNSHVNTINVKLILICSFQTIIYSIKDQVQLTSKIVQIISAILIYFIDPYEKVRLQAISSVYNVMNFLYNSCLRLFIKIFTYLLQLVPDQNPQIKTAVSFLNHTLKILVNDAILNHQYFDINEFMSILIENFITQSAAIKQFIIDWFISIDQITQIQVTFYLPLVFKQLFKLASFDSTTLKDKSEECLKNFLYGFKELLRHRPNIQKKIKPDSFSMLCGVLIEVIKECLECEVKYHALQWLQVFCQLFQNQIKFNQKIQEPKLNVYKSQIWLKDIKQSKSNSFTNSLSYLGLIKQEMNEQLDESIMGSILIQPDPSTYLIDIFLSYFKDFILLVLHSFSDDNQKIRKITKRINNVLLNCYLIVKDKSKPANQVMRQHPVQFGDQEQSFIQKLEVPLIFKLTKFLKESRSTAKIEAIMKWIKIIYSNSQNPQIYLQINSLIQRIIQKICDRGAQKQLFQLLTDSVFLGKYLNLFVQTLLSYFYQNESIDSQKILIQMIATQTKDGKSSLYIQNSQNRYITILQRLVCFQAQKDKFKQRMIQNLISILITEQSLTSLRKKIRIYKNKYTITKTSQSQEKQMLSLVKKLFQYFCVNQGFVIVFCFLTGMYRMVGKILNNLAVEGGLTRQKIKSFMKASYLIQSPNLDHFKLDLIQFFPAMKAYLGFIMAIPSGKLNKALLDRIPQQIQFDFQEQTLTQKETQLQNQLFSTYLCIQQKIKQEVRVMQEYQKEKIREREESMTNQYYQRQKRVKSLAKEQKKQSTSLKGVFSQKRLFKKISIKLSDEFRQKQKN